MAFFIQIDFLQRFVCIFLVIKFQMSHKKVTAGRKLKRKTPTAAGKEENELKEKRIQTSRESDTRNDWRLGEKA